MAGETTSCQGPDDQTRRAFYQEVRDAALLLEYAVSQGRVVGTTLISRIKVSQGFLSEGAVWPDDERRTDFEAAYRDLARAMKPITAASLRATSDEPRSPSAARWFSMRLYVWVFLCAAFIVTDRVLLLKYPPPPTGGSIAVAASSPASPAPADPGPWPVVRDICHTLLPFVFGLVGALTYLLRSAHAYIAERTFDLNRRPEYYNRMVLGFLGGGIALIFTSDNAGVGQNAVSFLIGYNNDYLFQMIERLGQAVFPKEPRTQPAAAVLSGISLEGDTLGGGDAGNATVAVSGAAPAGGLLVTLTADDGIELQSGTVKIPEGAISGAFTFKVAQLATPGSRLHITARQDSNAVTATVTVK